MGGMHYYGLLFLFCEVVHGHKFPGNFLKCHLSDKDLDQCLGETIETVFNRYGKNGIPSLNLPSMDPLKIDELEIGAGTGAVQLVQRYRKVKIFGVSNAMIVRAHYDQYRNILNFTAQYPELRQQAKYNISGKVMMLSVYGNGDSTHRLISPTVIHVATFKDNFKNGKKYIHVENYSVRIDVKGAHYHFSDLFNGDEKLLQILLKVLNDNWKEIFEDVREGTERSYGVVCKAIANKFFDTVPFDDIFLK